jgi:uncharacterized protein (DUF488 family)
MADVIWTIGHSTRELDEFLGLLAESGVRRLADVRRTPGSKRFPHFNSDELESSLADSGVGYRHYPALGGRRSQRAAGSPNTAWRVEAFNAFADFMATPDFACALEDLMDLARDRPTALMCSEAVPWRCHRRLIGDALTVRGWLVQDIIGARKVEPHRLTPFARVEGETITYPAESLFGA